MEPKPGSVEPLASPPRGIIIAGGCSLTVEQIDHIRHSGERFFIIGINNAFEICNFLDLIYCADHDFIHEFGKGFPPGVPIYSTWNSKSGAPAWAPFDHVTYLKGIDPPRFTEDLSSLSLGSNSGFQAINLALHLGIKELILLGYDFKKTGGRSHWFGDYEIPRFRREGDWLFWVRAMERAAPSAKARGMRIINCSPGSALNCFEKMDIKDAIKARDHYRHRL